MSNDQTRFARRSRFEMSMDVLGALYNAPNGTLKMMHVLYRSNSSWFFLNKFLLPHLLSKKLITEFKDFGKQRLFTITELGRIAFRNYEMARQIVNVSNEDLGLVGEAQEQ
jgi:predicted transcriptional regulator